MGKDNFSKLIPVGIVTLLVALAVGVFVNARRTEAPAEVRPDIGYAAPPLVYTDDKGGVKPLSDLDGKPVRLEDYRGKVVFINFWATWCPPCKQEMPDIQRIHEKYGDKVKVLAVNATAQDNEEAVRRFVEQFKLTFDVPLDKTDDVTSAYQVRFFPTSFFIDKDGVIREKREGAMNYALMEAGVSKASR